MNARPPAPRFTMTRAATPPVYASPARADFPNERHAAVKAIPPRTTARGNLYPVQIATADIPEPPMTHGAGLIVAAVIWWTVVAGLIALCICTYALVTHDPTPIPACVVGPGRECPVAGAGGRTYTAYWVAWSTSVGIASPTPGGQP